MQAGRRPGETKGRPRTEGQRNTGTAPQESRPSKSIREKHQLNIRIGRILELLTMMKNPTTSNEIR